MLERGISTNEMDQLSEAMERAEYKLTRTLSIIATARRAGFRVPPDGDDLLACAERARRHSPPIAEESRAGLSGS